MAERALDLFFLMCGAERKCSLGGREARGSRRSPCAVQRGSKVVSG